LRSITTVLINSKADAICLSLAMCSFSLMSLFLSLFEMTMSTSLLCTEQWAAWSHHLQLLQHSLKCFDIQQHFKKSIILCFWQLIQLSEINMSWLWIRITLMYNSWWVLICCDVIQIHTNRMLSLNRVRITIVWEKWVYKANCCWSTSRTKLTSVFTRARATT